MMLSVNVCACLFNILHNSRVLKAPASQALGVFTTVVVIVSIGSLVVTIQAKVRFKSAFDVAFYRSFDP